MFHTEKLALPEILGQIEALAITPQGKAQINGLTPQGDVSWIEKSQGQVMEMVAILNVSGTIPLNPLVQFNKAFEDLGRDMVLGAGQIHSIGSFLEDVDRLKRFMGSKTQVAPEVSTYALSMDGLPVLLDRIREAIHGDRVQDDASNHLAKLRRQIRLTEDKIRDKLSSILQQAGNESLLTDAHIAMRDGRYVIPVKSAARSKIPGLVLDTSKSGGTAFIEPEAVRRLSEALGLMRIEEENECFRILAELSEAISKSSPALSFNREAMVTYDVLSAKGKYCIRIKGTQVPVHASGQVKLVAARHPQLGDEAVALDLSLDGKSMVITGPNTGGKTVVLKTVGLLSLMAMCGLPVPADSRSVLRVFDHVLADIGDGQSIAQNLSTFSAHIVNIQAIVNRATANSLVLLDEVGSGTEPNEGAGIAIAILEALASRGACILATTHFSQLKQFAKDHPGFINGSMLFDTESLNPLYRLAVGEAGKSHALLIALKLGLATDLLDRAHRLTYGQPFDRKAYLDLLAQQQRALEAAPVAPPSGALGGALSGPALAPPSGPPGGSPGALSGGAPGGPTGGPTGAFIIKASPFKVGDSVYLPALKTGGIVLTPANRKGDHTVEVKGKKMILNHKRMKPFIDQSDLYPENYDMDIVTKSWKQRKAEKALSKGKKVVLDHDQN